MKPGAYNLYTFSGVPTIINSNSLKCFVPLNVIIVQMFTVLLSLSVEVSSVDRGGCHLKNENYFCSLKIMLE